MSASGPRHLQCSVCAPWKALTGADSKQGSSGACSGQPAAEPSAHCRPRGPAAPQAPRTPRCGSQSALWAPLQGLPSGSSLPSWLCASALSFSGSERGRRCPRLCTSLRFSLCGLQDRGWALAGASANLPGAQGFGPGRVCPVVLGVPACLSEMSFLGARRLASPRSAVLVRVRCRLSGLPAPRPSPPVCPVSLVLSTFGRRACGGGLVFRNMRTPWDPGSRRQVSGCCPLAHADTPSE